MSEDIVVEGTAPGPSFRVPWFTRPVKGRVAGGVAAGLARRFGLAPWAARLGFVALALMLCGVPWYLGLWAATRRDDQDAPVGTARAAAAAALGVLGLVLLLSGLASIAPFLALMALLLGGVLVLGRIGPGPVAAPSDGRRALVNAGAAALVVGVLTAVLGGVSTGAVLLVMALVFAGVMVASRAGTGEAATGPAGVASTVARPAMRPPTLLLLTAATALVAAAVLWLVTYERSSLHPVGAVAAVGVVVAGLGQMLGAFRGRSHLVAPVGAALAVPLAVAGALNVPLQVGEENPRALPADGVASKTVVLAPGAAPVQVTRAAVVAGLRELVVRRGAGIIDVRIDRSVPATLDVASMGSQCVDAGPCADGPRHTVTTLRGEGPDTIDHPITVRVEGGPGEVWVRHALPGQEAAERPAVERARARQDLAARRALLARELEVLAATRSAYQKERNALASGARVPAPVLTQPEEVWMSGPDAPPVADADPTLRGLGRLRALRFDQLRAEWRVAQIRRGIASLEAALQTPSGRTP